MAGLSEAAFFQGCISWAEVEDCRCASRENSTGTLSIPGRQSACGAAGYCVVRFLPLYLVQMKICGFFLILKSLLKTVRGIHVSREAAIHNEEEVLLECMVHGKRNNLAKPKIPLLPTESSP